MLQLSFQKHGVVELQIGTLPKIQFLNNLLLEDFVLADRGFDIAGSVGFYGPEVKISTFTKGKKQRSRADVKSTQELLVSGYMSKDLWAWLGINTQYHKAYFLLILSQKMVAIQQ